MHGQHRNLPLLSGEIVDKVIESYEQCGKTGNAMAIVVVLTAVGFILVMAPSFFNYFSTPLPELSTFGIISTSLHAFFGSLSELLE